MYNSSGYGNVRLQPARHLSPEAKFTHTIVIQFVAYYKIVHRQREYINCYWFNQSINLSINLLIYQSINLSIYQSVNIAKETTADTAATEVIETRKRSLLSRTKV